MNRPPRNYAECARIFRETDTATEAARLLGITPAGARSLRKRLRTLLDPDTGRAFDVGEGRAGRPAWPKVPDSPA